jgi:hypothetical protein
MDRRRGCEGQKPQYTDLDSLAEIGGFMRIVMLVLANRDGRRMPQTPVAAPMTPCRQSAATMGQATVVRGLRLFSGQ